MPLRTRPPPLPFANGLIHATPMGMPAHPGMPVSADLIEQRHWVADIVYMPLVTELLATAAKKGCRTLPGGGMTVFRPSAHSASSAVASRMRSA